jgi:hypothetical protein
MQPHLQRVSSPPPRVFHYSLDWRFLLPIADAQKILVLSEKDIDFSQTLEQVGISVSDHLSFPNSELSQEKNIQALVLPFGLPVRWISTKQEEQVQFYRSLQHLLGSDGYLLVGFNNAWHFLASTPSKYHPSTPRRISYQLEQAGFKSIKVFGAMPNLSIPEYIFDMESRAVHFALYHRFRRKPVVLNTLRALAGTIGLARISNLLPCYFAVATV